MAGGPSSLRAYNRRSGRIARRLSIVLHWRDSQGRLEEIPAETPVLSQHGCRVSCPARLKLGDEVSVWWPEEHREAGARIVFRVLDATKDFVELGFEFLDADNFWGIEFPADIFSGTS
jgi:PilZ domain